MGFFDKFNGAWQVKLKWDHPRAHIVCQKCHVRMLLYITYYQCPVCSKIVGKPTTIREYLHPDEKLALLERKLEAHTSNQPDAPLGYFGAPIQMVVERSWLVPVGWLLVLNAGSHWFYSLGRDTSNFFTPTFAWGLPCLVLIHILAGFTMLWGSLTSRYWAVGLLLAAGLPVVLYMFFNVPHNINVQGMPVYPWDPTLAKLSFALLAIHLVWDANYLYREAKCWPRSTWGGD